MYKYIYYQVGLFSSYQWLYRYLRCGTTGLITQGVCGYCVGVFVCVQDVLSTHLRELTLTCMASGIGVNFQFGADVS